MAPTLCIAVGNPLRGDDGVAHRVLDLLGPAAGVDCLRTHQLAPELAEKIAHARNVIIIDADIRAGRPRIEPIARWEPRDSPLTHSMSPAEVVHLANKLFGFDGRAFVCHVPSVVFTAGEGLSARAEANARRATSLVAQLVTAFEF